MPWADTFYCPVGHVLPTAYYNRIEDRLECNVALCSLPVKELARSPVIQAAYQLGGRAAVEAILLERRATRRLADAARRNRARTRRRGTRGS